MKSIVIVLVLVVASIGVEGFGSILPSIIERATSTLPKVQVSGNVNIPFGSSKNQKLYHIYINNGKAGQETKPVDKDGHQLSASGSVVISPGKFLNALGGGLAQTIKQAQPVVNQYFLKGSKQEPVEFSLHGGGGTVSLEHLEPEEGQQIRQFSLKGVKHDPIDFSLPGISIGGLQGGVSLEHPEAEALSLEGVNFQAGQHSVKDPKQGPLEFSLSRSHILPEGGTVSLEHLEPEEGENIRQFSLKGVKQEHTLPEGGGTVSVEHLEPEEVKKILQIQPKERNANAVLEPEASAEAPHYHIVKILHHPKKKEENVNTEVSEQNSSEPSDQAVLRELPQTSFDPLSTDDEIVTRIGGGFEENLEEPVLDDKIHPKVAENQPEGPRIITPEDQHLEPVEPLLTEGKPGHLNLQLVTTKKKAKTVFKLPDNSNWVPAENSQEPTTGKEAEGRSYPILQSSRPIKDWLKNLLNQESEEPDIDRANEFTLSIDNPVWIILHSLFEKFITYPLKALHYKILANRELGPIYKLSVFLLAKVIKFKLNIFSAIYRILVNIFGIPSDISRYSLVPLPSALQNVNYRISAGFRLLNPMTWFRSAALYLLKFSPRLLTQNPHILLSLNNVGLFGIPAFLTKLTFTAIKNYFSHIISGRFGILNLSLIPLYIIVDVILFGFYVAKGVTICPVAAVIRIVLLKILSFLPTC